MGRSITMSQIGDTAAYRQGLPLSTLVDYMPFYDPHMGPRSIEISFGGRYQCFRGTQELIQRRLQ